MTMKKMICALLALAMLLCASAMAQTIAPQNWFDPNEGTYPAAFDRAALKDGTLHGVRLYTEDWYDIVEVSTMAVGDTFEAEGKSVTVESRGVDEFGQITINGGYEQENGYTLTTEEDTNGFTTTGYDDACTYTERGTLDLALAESVTFTDSYDIDADAIINGKQPLTATGIEAVTEAIMSSEFDSFYAYNTKVVIENGKVVEITRRFVP